MVWAAGHDAEDAVRSFDEQLDLDLPVLLDPAGEVHELYFEHWPYTSWTYPQQWIIDPEGQVVYISDHYVYDDVVAVLERYLD